MKIFNTLSGKKEDFIPQENNKVGMYVCGVTPYDNSHIGHAMSYIYFDVVRRYLKFRGYDVKYVQNITDIDDKIIARANLRKMDISELTKEFIDSFHNDLKALNILPPDVEPRATEMLQEIQNVIQGLIDKGFAYPAGGSVYFKVKKVSDYGKLSRRSLDSMMNSEGALGSGEKESPLDFVLWKAAKPDEPSWKSPWGNGRPGWHIECSAMSLKYLGKTVDIHGGGQDLVFPHHENEIAQSESFTGEKPFVRYWMHNGMVQISGEKMSKSLGNLVTIKEALGKFSSDAIRIFILSSHYRGPLTYSEEALDAAERGADRLRQAANLVSSSGIIHALPEGIKDSFNAVMDDDFNTSQAIAVLFEMARQINLGNDRKENVSDIQAVLKELGSVLGLTFVVPEVKSTDAEPFIQLLIATRKSLRDAKQFQLADDIRKKLDELGVVLEDSPQGTQWKRKR